MNTQVVRIEYLGLSEERPRQADKLPLAHAQVLAALGDLVLKAVLEARRVILS